MSKYMIMSAPDADSLERVVNDALAAGFECVGGVAYVSGRASQAMIGEHEIVAAPTPYGGGTRDASPQAPGRAGARATQRANPAKVLNGGRYKIVSFVCPDCSKGVVVPLPTVTMENGSPVGKCDECGRRSCINLDGYFESCLYSLD